MEISAPSYGAVLRRPEGKQRVLIGRPQDMARQTSKHKALPFFLFFFVLSPNVTVKKSVAIS